MEGSFCPRSGKYFDAINPSNGEVFARIADADTVDVQTAISAARASFDHRPLAANEHARSAGNSCLK